MSDVAQRIHRMIATATGDKTPEEVAAAPSLRELGLDSLALYAVLDEIEATMSLRLDEDPPLGISVAGLVALVEARLEGPHA
ncbi:MAG TPA: acyl carrier protein [Ideonella sp.]|nr:acyl carrier protein [Ideonella sp.]